VKAQKLALFSTLERKKGTPVSVFNFTNIDNFDAG